MRNCFRKRTLKIRKNTQNVDSLIEVIKKHFLDNLWKSITFISFITGSIYILYYLIGQVEYLPLTSLADLSTLAFVYFFIAFVIVIYPIFFIVVPVEMIYQVISIYVKESKKSWQTWVGILLFVFILVGLFIYAYLIISYYLLAFGFVEQIKRSLQIVIGMCILFLWSMYYNLKKDRVYLLGVLIIGLFIFLLDPLSKGIAKKLRLGNYDTTLIITDQRVCKELFKTNNKFCELNGFVLWRSSNEYILKSGDGIYKIQARYVIGEKYKRKEEKKKSTNASP